MIAQGLGSLPRRRPSALPVGNCLHAELCCVTPPAMASWGPTMGLACISLEEVDMLVEREAALVNQAQRSLASSRLAAATESGRCRKQQGVSGLNHCCGPGACCSTLLGPQQLFIAGQQVSAAAKIPMGPLWCVHRLAKAWAGRGLPAAHALQGLLPTSCRTQRPCSTRTCGWCGA